MKIKISISSKQESGIESAWNEWIPWNNLTLEKQSELLDKFVANSDFMDLQFEQEDIQKLGDIDDAILGGKSKIQSHIITPDFDSIETCEGSIGGRRVICLEEVPTDPHKKNLTIKIATFKPEDLVQALQPLLKTK